MKQIFFFIQHYLRGADGLICRLNKSVKKEGTLAVSVDAESFKKCKMDFENKSVLSISLSSKTCNSQKCLVDLDVHTFVEDDVTILK
jgi:hypothetical protein